MVPAVVARWESNPDSLQFHKIPGKGRSPSSLPGVARPTLTLHGPRGLGGQDKPLPDPAPAGTQGGQHPAGPGAGSWLEPPCPSLIGRRQAPASVLTAVQARTWGRSSGFELLRLQVMELGPEVAGELQLPGQSVCGHRIRCVSHEHNTQRRHWRPGAPVCPWKGGLVNSRALGSEPHARNSSWFLEVRKSHRTQPPQISGPVNKVHCASFVWLELLQYEPHIYYRGVSRKPADPKTAKS